MTTQTDFRGVLRFAGSRTNMHVAEVMMAVRTIDDQIRFPAEGVDVHVIHTGGPMLTKVNVYRPSWRFAVYNTRTGVRIQGDDMFGELHEVLAEANAYVEEVRNAWTRGYLKRKFS